MSTNENKTLARRYYDEIANAEPERAQATAEQLLTPDFTFYPNVPEAQRGILAHKQFLARHHQISRDQKWTCQEMIAEGDTVVCRFIVEGTHQGIFHGIAPAGRRISVQGVDFFHIAHDGRTGLLGRSTSRIAEVRRFVDLKRMLDQMSGDAEPDPHRP
jgi:predicted ester cyclase